MRINGSSRQQAGSLCFVGSLCVSGVKARERGKNLKTLYYCQQKRARILVYKHQQRYTGASSIPDRQGCALSENRSTENRIWRLVS